MVIKTKKTIIFIIIIFLIPLSTALNFTLNSPEKISKEAEFSVAINPQETVNESYDVKIFINKHTKEFSEIFYKEQWVSPFKYLQAAFPETLEFKIKSHFVGETNICARLRRSAAPNEGFSEVCSKIIVVNSTTKEKSSMNNSTGEPDKIQTALKESKKENKNESENQFFSTNKYELPNSQKSNQKETKFSEDKILLNPQNKDEQIKNSIITKQEKIRLGIIYGFLLFCLVVILLLALKRL